MTCEDCGRKYGDKHGFPDLIIPLDTWRQISTHGDETGLLCPSCICKRLAEKGLSCEGAFMSGPIRSVSPEMMTALRWIENLREQGHGWYCQKCGEHRDCNADDLQKDDRLDKFLDVVSRIPATLTCCKCSREEDNGSGGTVDARSGFEIITDPVTGQQSEGRHICGDCMRSPK